MDDEPSSATTIRARIDSAIALWRECTHDPPPFTLAELAVMALALNAKPLHDDDICAWILRTFAFYRQLRPEAAWNYLRRAGGAGAEACATEPDPSIRLALRMWPGGLERVLHTYAVPVRESQADADEDGEPRRTATRWTVGAEEALLFLRPRLWSGEETRRGHFPFLRLPPEIRNIVYDMVLGFPPSGISINCYDAFGIGTARAVHAISRSFEQAFDFELWRRQYRWYLLVGRVSDILSILSVNKQIRAEALYVFADINTFYFMSARHMARILCRMSTELRDNVRDIAFVHKPESGCVAALCTSFAILSRMKRLRRLRIFVSGEEFRQAYEFFTGREPVKFMGFDDAPAIGPHVELLLAGDYPQQVESQIRAESVCQHTIKHHHMLSQCRPRCRWQSWWTWGLIAGITGACLPILIKAADASLPWYLGQ